MLLLYYTPVVMYRGVFTVGIALIGVTDNNAIVSANALSDYSYVNTRDSVTSGTQIARCVTGLGPSAPDDNSAVGGVYFNGNRIPNVACSDSSSPIIRQQPAGDLSNLGVINIVQCATFSTAVEGIYTCIMINSSLMNESIRFGVYFTGRSEPLYNFIYPTLDHLSSLYTAAPVIDTPSSSTVTVADGSPLILSCTSRGSPPDTFTWRKDGSSILQSTSITAVDHTSTSAVFRAGYSVDSATASDIGTYTCTVTNPFGTDSATITVHVTAGKC